MDQDKVVEYALLAWGYKQGEVVSLMVHLGDRLGLYRAMDGAGPLTAAQLAARTSLHERWVLEWLRSQGAAGLLDSSDGVRFELTAEAAEVLANEEGSIWFAAGAFGPAATPDTIDRLVEAFRTGAGLSYDDLGPSAAHTIERMLAPWTRLVLVPQILPQLDGVTETLARGGTVVDVGCGAGVALATMARAFPASQFDGYDPSTNAIERARGNVAGLANVTLHTAGASELPRAATYDFVVTLDCIHDMPFPAEAIAAIRRCIKPSGTWLIKDIRSSGRWTDDQSNPLLAMMYGTSVTTCMSSALSAPGGAGLGTLGFNPELAERMCRDAGFTSFTMRDFDDPANLYYEVRP
jgi:2-polyprenyl-3-methyl-5-hydroxy-6-metoxy-1,4-benzoquinol methylase